MTVAELKAILSKIPDDSPVFMKIDEIVITVENVELLFSKDGSGVVSLL